MEIFKRIENYLFSNHEWKQKLWSFSRACSKWGVDDDQTNRMNRSIMSAHTIDSELYAFCKYMAEQSCLKHLQEMRQRHPRDNELKKEWHRYISQSVPMTHPQGGYQL